ncbi:hypothetical protein CL630_01840 [bacterium]|nr:hypothetical protein [bacterium]|tara:strand:+ start:14842 stop:15408 length:567 start_codon:yes stop_codon:yes gene_type:complete
MQNHNLKFKILSTLRCCFSLFAFHFKFKRGFGLIEILIASAILSVSLVTLTATTQIAFRIMKDSLERTQASFLSEEGIEVARTLRDISWSREIAPFDVEVILYPTFSAAENEWSLATTTTPIISNLFTRTIVFDDVYRRDSDGEIVSASSTDPKTLDPDTRQITSRVVWDTPEKNVEVSTYVTNIFQN